MAIVEITLTLEKEINKQFKAKSVDILEYLQSLEKNPNKSKTLSTVGGILIKQLRYEGYRFYFVVDGEKIRLYQKDELVDLLFRFVRMSNKKDQQTTINEIKEILLQIGPSGLE